MNKNLNVDLFLYSIKLYLKEIIIINLKLYNLILTINP